MNKHVLDTKLRSITHYSEEIKRPQKAIKAALLYTLQNLIP